MIKRLMVHLATVQAAMAPFLPVGTVDTEKNYLMYLLKSIH